MTKPSILELITGPLEEGQTIDLGDIELADVLGRFDTVALTTPLHSLPPDSLELIAQIRETLRTASKPDSGRGPLTKYALMVEWIIRGHLELYLEPDRPRADRLYVLEFQGPWQYVMFGHTTNLLGRLTEHQRAATAHGFALVNGWASPWVANAQPLEQEALLYAGWLHHHHYQERFFEMSFELGLKIVRIVFEKSGDWRSRSDASSGSARPPKTAD